MKLDNQVQFVFQQIFLEVVTYNLLRSCHLSELSTYVCDNETICLIRKRQGWAKEDNMLGWFIQRELNSLVLSGLTYKTKM